MNPLEHDLLDNARALRGLATALVGGADADDLLQDAVLAQLQLPEPPRRPLALLRRMLHFLAHKRGRSATRRRRHETLATPPSGEGDPAETAERAEMLQRLVAALVSLPEPYRAVLMARWFADQTPVEIARHTDVPVATVKSQLQRGLALLRERLGATDVDWCRSLCIALGLRPEAAVRRIGVGAAALLGVALVLIATTVWIWSSDALPVAPVAMIDAATPAASASGVSSAAKEPNAVAAGSRAEVRGPGLSAECTVCGRCVDETGAILAEGSARLRFAPPGLEYDPTKTGRELDAQQIASDGSFELHCAPGKFEVYVELTHGDRAVRCTGFRIGDNSRVELGEVVLPQGVPVRGRVVDSLGIAREGVRVAFSAGSRERWRAVAPLVDTDRGGQFTLICAPGAWRLSIPGERVLDPLGEFTVPASGGSIEVQLMARTELPAIEGHVADASGAPVGGAVVESRCDAGEREVAVTGADGAFTLRRSFHIDTGPVEIRCRHSEFDRAVVRSVAWGTRALRIVLPRSVALDIAAVAATTEEPIEDFAVRLWRPCDRAESSIEGFVQRNRGLHAGGRLRIGGIARGQQEVWLEPTDRSRWHGAFARALVGDDGASVRMALPAASSMAVAVTTASGAPVAGCRVELCWPQRWPVSLATTALRLEHWDALDPDPERKMLVVDSGRTDASGMVALRGPAEADLALRVIGPGCSPTMSSPVRCGGSNPVRVVAVPTGSLLAQVDAGGAREFAGSTLLLRRVSGLGEADSRSSTRLDADLRAVVSELPEGVWLLSVSCSFAPGWPIAEQEVVVRANEQAAAVLDVRRWQPGTARVSVRRSGAACAGRRLQLELLSPKAPFAPQGRGRFKVTDADGSIEFVGLPGRYRVTAPAVEGEPASVVDPAEFDLPSGGDVTLELRLAVETSR